MARELFCKNVIFGGDIEITRIIDFYNIKSSDDGDYYFEKSCIVYGNINPEKDIVDQNFMTSANQLYLQMRTIVLNNIVLNVGVSFKLDCIKVNDTDKDGDIDSIMAYYYLIRDDIRINKKLQIYEYMTSLMTDLYSLLNDCSILIKQKEGITL